MKELETIFKKLYPYVEFKFIFKNPLRLGSLFRFKDTLPETMRASVVYQYTCPKCNFGTYVGCTRRLLKARIDSHRGVSHRTGLPLSHKENSPVRQHSLSCRHNLNYNNFKILSQSSNLQSLPILESLFIKQLSPHLNNQTTSVPLYIS